MTFEPETPRAGSGENVPPAAQAPGVKAVSSPAKKADVFSCCFRPKVADGARRTSRSVAPAPRFCLSLQFSSRNRSTRFLFVAHALVVPADAAVRSKPDWPPVPHPPGSAGGDTGVVQEPSGGVAPPLDADAAAAAAPTSQQGSHRLAVVVPESEAAAGEVVDCEAEEASRPAAEEPEPLSLPTPASPPGSPLPVVLPGPAAGHGAPTPSAAPREGLSPSSAVSFPASSSHFFPPPADEPEGGDPWDPAAACRVIRHAGARAAWRAAHGVAPFSTQWPLFSVGLVSRLGATRDVSAGFVASRIASPSGDAVLRCHLDRGLSESGGGREGDDVTVLDVDAAFPPNGGSLADRLRTLLDARPVGLGRGGSGGGGGGAARCGGLPPSLRSSLPSLPEDGSLWAAHGGATSPGAVAAAIVAGSSSFTGRILYLTGPPGVGKSCLAAAEAAALDAAGRLRGGAFWADLRRLPAASDAAAAAASAVGAATGETRPGAAAAHAGAALRWCVAAASLGAQHSRAARATPPSSPAAVAPVVALLVLDSADDVLAHDPGGFAALLTDLCSVSPCVRVLVTGTPPWPYTSPPSLLPSPPSSLSPVYDATIIRVDPLPLRAASELLRAAYPERPALLPLDVVSPSLNARHAKEVASLVGRAPLPLALVACALRAARPGAEPAALSHVLRALRAASSAASSSLSSPAAVAASAQPAADAPGGGGDGGDDDGLGNALADACCGNPWGHVAELVAPGAYFRANEDAQQSAAAATAAAAAAPSTARASASSPSAPVGARSGARRSGGGRPSVSRRDAPAFAPPPLRAESGGGGDGGGGCGPVGGLTDSQYVAAVAAAARSAAAALPPGPARLAALGIAAFGGAPIDERLAIAVLTSLIEASSSSAAAAAAGGPTAGAPSAAAAVTAPPPSRQAGDALALLAARCFVCRDTRAATVSMHPLVAAALLSQPGSASSASRAVAAALSALLAVHEAAAAAAAAAAAGGESGGGGAAAAAAVEAARCAGAAEGLRAALFGGGGAGGSGGGRPPPSKAVLAGAARLAALRAAALAAAAAPADAAAAAAAADVDASDAAAANAWDQAGRGSGEGAPPREGLLPSESGDNDVASEAAEREEEREAAAAFAAAAASAAAEAAAEAQRAAAARAAEASARASRAADSAWRLSSAVMAAEEAALQCDWEDAEAQNSVVLEIVGDRLRELAGAEQRERECDGGGGGGGGGGASPAPWSGGGAQLEGSAAALIACRARALVGRATARARLRRHAAAALDCEAALDALAGGGGGSRADPEEASDDEESGGKEGTRFEPAQAEEPFSPRPSGPLARTALLLLSSCRSACGDHGGAARAAVRALVAASTARGAASAAVADAYAASAAAAAAAGDHGGALESLRLAIGVRERRSPATAGDPALPELFRRVAASYEALGRPREAAAAARRAGAGAPARAPGDGRGAGAAGGAGGGAADVWADQL